MRIKKLSAALLASMLCMSCLSMTAFAYTGDDAAAETEAVEKPTAAVTEDSKDKETEETTEETGEELPYNFTVGEDGKVVFSFDGKEYEYDMNKEEPVTKGKVVTNGSRLNVRTGAGLDYEVIDQLRPGEEVVVVGTEGDWYEITVPEKKGYVHSDYLELLKAAEGNSEMDKALIMMFMSMFQNMNTGAGSDGSNALTPDGNMNLVDDIGSSTGEGKQFITVTTKNGNYFYIIIDRDDKGTETVHFLNLVDEADLMKLMDDEEAAQFAPPVDEPTTNTEPETEPTEPVETEPETVEPEPEKAPNVLPAIILILAMAGGGGFFLFKKVKGKQKEKEQAKPDPDADYVDDEGYGYEEADEYTDDGDEDYSDEDDNEPV